MSIAQKSAEQSANAYESDCALLIRVHWCDSWINTLQKSPNKPNFRRNSCRCRPLWRYESHCKARFSAHQVTLRGAARLSISRSNPLTMKTFVSTSPAGDSGEESR